MRRSLEALGRQVRLERWRLLHEEAAAMAFAGSVMGALGLGNSLEVAVALEVADAAAW